MLHKKLYIFIGITLAAAICLGNIKNKPSKPTSSQPLTSVKHNGAHCDSCDGHHSECLDGQCGQSCSDHQQPAYQQGRAFRPKRQRRSPYKKTYDSKPPLDYDSPKPIRDSHYYVHNRPAHQPPFQQGNFGQAGFRSDASHYAAQTCDPYDPRFASPCDPTLHQNQGQGFSPYGSHSNTPQRPVDQPQQNPFQESAPNNTSAPGFDSLDLDQEEFEQPLLVDPNHQSSYDRRGRMIAPTSFDNPSVMLAGSGEPSGRPFAPLIRPSSGITTDPLAPSSLNWQSPQYQEKPAPPEITTTLPIPTPAQSPSPAPQPNPNGMQGGCGVPVPDPNWIPSQQNSAQDGCYNSNPQEMVLQGDYFQQDGCGGQLGSEFATRDIFSRRPRRYLGFESQFGQPYFGNGNPGITLINGATTIIRPMEYDQQFANQFLMGFESANGPGFRFDLFDLDARSNQISEVVGGGITTIAGDLLNTSNNGDKITAEQNINITNYRPEVFKRIYFPVSTLTGGFGLEHLSSEQQSKFQLIPHGFVAPSNIVFVNNTFRGTGPTFSLDYYRPIGHSRFAVVGGFRGSVLLGKNEQEVIHNNVLVLSEKAERTVTVFGAFVGTEWGRMIGGGNKRLFLRGTVEGKSWQSIGVGRDNHADIGWVSFNFAAGLSY